MTKVLTLLREAGVEKVNFAGGEPFRFKAELGKLLRHARSLGMYTSIITNGSLLTPEWMKANAGNLDMLGMSFDSASDAVNYDLGRWAKGGKRPDPAAPDRAVSKLRRAAELAHEHGVAFKMNTVVTALNADELLAPLINEVRPARWKVFQVLAVDTENSGEGALTNVRPLLVGREAFDAYVDRNRSQLDDPGILKAEPNDVMQASYIILDERARLLDPSTGGKIPTQVRMMRGTRPCTCTDVNGASSRAVDPRRRRA